MSAVGVVFGVLVAILLGTSASARNSSNRTFGSGVALHRTASVPCNFLNRPTLSLPIPRDVVAPWELCVTKGLTDGEVLQAQRIIGGTAAEIQTYQVNNSQAPIVTVANPELLNVLQLSKQERSILEREGIIND